MRNSISYVIVWKDDVYVSWRNRNWKDDNDFKFIVECEVYSVMEQAVTPTNCGYVATAFCVSDGSSTSNPTSTAAAASTTDQMTYGELKA